MSDLELLVRLGSERYSIPVGAVLEVAEMGSVTPVPGGPASLLGVRNLRGAVLPVLDLASLVGLSPDRPPQSIVVVEHAGRRAGLAVEALIDVAPLPAVLDGARANGLRGRALLDGSLVGALDVGALLDGVQAGSPA